MFSFAAFVLANIESIFIVVPSSSEFFFSLLSLKFSVEHSLLFPCLHPRLEIFCCRWFLPSPIATLTVDLISPSPSQSSKTNTIFIIVVAARSAVASPNISTIGNKVCYLLHSSDRSPAWHPVFPRSPLSERANQSGRWRRLPYPRL
jgi:hypothetical protein